MIYCAKCGSEMPEYMRFCARCGAQMGPGPAGGYRPEMNTAWPNNYPANTYAYSPYAAVGLMPPQKKPNIILPIIIGIAATVAAVIIVIYFIGGGRVEVVEYDWSTNLMFGSVKNYDKQIDGKAVELSFSDVQYTHNYIKQNYPEFELEEIDRYQTQLLIDDFNQNPANMQIYLAGNPEDAGLSATYAILETDDTGDLIEYYYLNDQEFSDTSGMQYSSTYWNTYFEDSEDFALDLISMSKYLYSDADIWYWEINWSDNSDDTKETRRAALTDFLTVMRYTRVYDNIDKAFILEVYTGIEGYECIGDLVDWGLDDAEFPSSTPAPAA